MTDVDFFIFGDSIAYGAWDREGGWAQRLKKFMDRKFMNEFPSNPSAPNWYAVFNLGISSQIVEDLLKRVENEMKNRISGSRNVMIFAVGMNDAQYINAERKTKAEPEEFKKNLQKLIDVSRKFSSDIVFIGLNPVVESKSDPMPWNKENSLTNENVRKYNEMMKSTCFENEVHFIEIFENWIKIKYEKLLFDDGLHPNSEGHEKIFEAVKDFLIKEKII